MRNKIQNGKNLIREFIHNEKSGGLLLIACTIISLIVSNLSFGKIYIDFWHFSVFGESISHWINDGLMAIFFLMVGLELKNEFLGGELANIKRALLPISAAIGGMIIPAAIYMLFNHGTPSHAGTGIPMATDIAFALAILSLLGKKVPFQLKVFLTALAVIDDLGAIIVIALFYSTTLVLTNLFIALGIFVVLLFINHVLKINNLIIYIIGGIALWYFMLHSGIHATIAGVLLAFTIPDRKKDDLSNSQKMQRSLHLPVIFIILPLFAIANMAMELDMNWYKSLQEPFALGIIIGLVIGKPVGIFFFSFLSVKFKLCRLFDNLKWKYILGVGMLGGIGFTMSIFITGLAFSNDQHYIDDSKLMILLSSVISGILGYIWLNKIIKRE